MTHVRAIVLAGLLLPLLGIGAVYLAWPTAAEPRPAGTGPEIPEMGSASPERTAPLVEPSRHLAQQADPPVAPGPQGRRIRVTDTRDRPVPRASLMISDRRTERTLSCDDDGAISLSLDGVVALVASAPGLATCRLPARELAAAADPVIRLPAATSLQVRVVDDTGHLVAGQRVEAVIEKHLDGTNQFLLDRSVTCTNAQGIASFEQLGNAQYWICVPRWRRWSGVDLYEVKPMSGSLTAVDARVTARPAGECLEVRVDGLEPASAWTQYEHPRLSIEIEGVSGLERIYPPGIATVGGEPSASVRVRVVATRDGYPCPNEGCTEWQAGVLGQSWPLQFDAVGLSPPK